MDMPSFIRCFALYMTAIQARLNGFRDNKGGSVITGQTIEGNKGVSTPGRVTTYVQVIYRP